MCKKGRKSFAIILICLCAMFFLQTSDVDARTKISAPKISSTNVAASGKIKLSWAKIDTAVEYQVYRSASESGSYKRVAKVTKPYFTNTSVEPGKKYYYYVVAVAADGTVSAKSNIVYRTCDLPQPTVKLSSAASTGKIKVSWNAVEDALKYEVYRSESKGGTYKKISTTTNTSITNTSAEAGRTYYYKVRALAKNSSANSAYSVVKYRTCDLPRPVIELSNVASSGKIKVSWNAVKGAVKYQVYRAASKNGNYTRLVTTTRTDITNATAEAGVTYYYKVRALAENSSADSAYSTIKSSLCTLARPNVSIALNEDGKPRLTWDAVEGCDSYEVYRSMAANGVYKKISTTKYKSLTNTSAAAGVTYYYKVRAIHSNSAANSTYSKVKKITPSVKNEQLKEMYVVKPQANIYELPDSSTESIRIPYMTKVKLGLKITNSTTGSWYRVFYKEQLGYVWVAAGNTVFKEEKSSMDYKGASVYHQEVVDLAAEIAKEWNTYYAHNQSNGVMNEDGSYGFDCSGLVCYCINTVMQKYVPTYRLTSKIEELVKLDSVFNAGYDDCEFTAQTVELTDIQPGDVIFFTQKSKNDHCGLYLGNQEFAHCSSYWNQVIISPLTDEYRDEISVIRRYIPEKVELVNVLMRTTESCGMYSVMNGLPEYKLMQLKKNERVTVICTNSVNWAYVRYISDDGMQEQKGYVLLTKLTDMIEE